MDVCKMKMHKGNLKDAPRCRTSRWSPSSDPHCPPPSPRTSQPCPRQTYICTTSISINIHYEYPQYILPSPRKKDNERTDDSGPHRYTSRSHSPAPSSRTSTVPPSCPNASAPRPSGRTRRDRRCRRRRSLSSLVLRLWWVAEATSLFGVRAKKDMKSGSA